MDIVLLLHSFVRFLVLLAAIVGLAKTVINLAQSRAPESVDRTISSAFLGVYDLQMLLGLLIILLGGLTQVLHPVVMFIGLVSAHGLQSMGKRVEGSQLNLYRLALYIVPLAIILVGLALVNHLPI